MLTKRQFEVLKQMATAHEREEFEEAEILCEGIICYLGDDRISVGTLKAFIDHVLVSRSDCGGNGMDMRLGGYWHINETGLCVVRRPELADEVWLRIRKGGSFTIKDDRIVDI